MAAGSMATSDPFTESSSSRRRSSNAPISCVCYCREDSGGGDDDLLGLPKFRMDGGEKMDEKTAFHVERK